MEVILATPIVLVMGWGICEFRHALQMSQVLHSAAKSGVIASRQPTADRESIEATVRSTLCQADSRFNSAEISIQMGVKPLRGLTTARTPGVADFPKIACQITIPYQQVCRQPAMLLEGPRVYGKAAGN